MIRSAILAAIAVAGISTATNAATLESGSYKVNLTLVENYWDCYDYDVCLSEEPEVIPLWGLSLGDTVAGEISFSTKSPSSISVDISWNGNLFVNNQMFSYIDENSYWNTGWDDYINFSLVDGVFSGLYKRLPYSGEWQQNAIIEFTSVDVAPVPLPASAALFPLGFGALAMMRKRRKRIS